MTEAEWAEALVQTYARSLAIGFCVIDPIRIAVMLAVSPPVRRFVCSKARAVNETCEM